MDSIAKYRAIIRQVLEKYRAVKPAFPGVEMQLVFDEDHDHYLLMSVGWDEDHWMFGCIVHIDIKEDKIWIRHDGTDVGIANDLIEIGVPKEKIVLAFHAPYKRPFTGFAVS